MDASVFEHFVYQLLRYVRSQQCFDDRPVVLLMDNASIHRQPALAATVLAFKAFLLFTP